MGGKFEYLVEDDCHCDYLLACADGIIPTIQSNIPKERRILILMENPSIWAPPLEYLDYFGAVITPTPVPASSGTRVITNHPAVSWFYGLKFRTDQGLSHVPLLENYLELNDLTEMDVPPKSKLLSCIVSNKGGTPGHNWRIESAQALKAHFGDNIDMFGFGWNPIADKREAIDPYRFTVVIENESRVNYWTEKLSDAILGYSQPIYFGAPNIQKFFGDSVKEHPYGIDSHSLLNTVKAEISGPINSNYILEHRQNVLFKHNVFYYIADLIQNNKI